MISAATRDANKEIVYRAVAALPASAANDDSILGFLIDSLRVPPGDDSFTRPLTEAMHSDPQAFYSKAIGSAAAEKLGDFGPAANKAIPALVQVALDWSGSSCHDAAERAFSRIDAKDASLHSPLCYRTGIKYFVRVRLRFLKDSVLMERTPSPRSLKCRVPTHFHPIALMPPALYTQSATK